MASENSITYIVKIENTHLKKETSVFISVRNQLNDMRPRRKKG